MIKLFFSLLCATLFTLAWLLSELGVAHWAKRSVLAQSHEEKKEEKLQNQGTKTSAENESAREAVQKQASENDARYKALEEKAKTLAEKERALAAQEASLKDKEALLKQQLVQYETAISDLKKQLRGLQEKDSQKIDSLRNVYAQMEPKRAARILDDLPVDQSSLILSGMKKETAAQILGRMNPTQAKELTQRLMRLPASEKKGEKL